jgi:hypothetical protein
MADITKCLNEECPLRHLCKRWRASDNIIKQSYQEFQFTEDASGNYDCDYFMEHIDNN